MQCVVSTFVAVSDEVNGSAGPHLFVRLVVSIALRFVNSPFDFTIQLREILDGELVQNQNRMVPVPQQMVKRQ